MLHDIMLAPLAAKALVARLKDTIDAVYVKMVGESQYGAVSKRGTAQASHILRALVEHAEIATRSFTVSRGAGLCQA